LQDLFAELRPNMTRYSSLEEVNAALVELEEHERTVSTDKANNEKHSDTEKPSRRTTSNKMSVNGQSVVNGTDDNGVVHEDHGDSDSDSGSGTVDPDRHEEELDEENRDDGSESEEEDDDGGGPASDEDDEVHVRQKVAEVDPQEEADFELDLKAVMQVSFRLFLCILLLLPHLQCIFICYEMLIYEHSELMESWSLTLAFVLAMVGSQT
jgi:regulator of nonsense transcripts 2